MLHTSRHYAPVPSLLSTLPLPQTLREQYRALATPDTLHYVVPTARCARPRRLRGYKRTSARGYRPAMVRSHMRMP
jgi:hypothetical protein